MNLAVKEIGPEYNEPMLRILQNNPMASKDFTVCMDRKPSFMASAQLHYESFRYAGVFENDKLLGYILLGLEHTYIGGKPEPVFTFTDAYRDRNTRKQYVTFCAVDYFLNHWNNPSEIGYYIVLKGNKPVDRISSIITPFQHNKEGPPASDHRAQFRLPFARLIAELESYAIMITFEKKEDNRLDVRAATMADLDDIVGLLERDFQDRTFAPVIQRSSVLDWIRKRPNFGIENFMLARHRGELVGVCSYWDTSSFKQMRVVRYGSRMKWTKFLYNLGGKLFRFQSLPKIDECFREINISEFAAKDRDPLVMKAMLTKIYNQCRKQKVHLLNFGSAKEDPLLEARKGFLFEKVDAQMFLCALSEKRLDQVAPLVRLPYFSMALI